MFLMYAAAAHAQSVRFDGQLFRPSADALGTMWVEDTHTGPDGYGTARAYVETAVAPVRWRGDDDQTAQLVSGLFGLDLAGAYHYHGLRFGAALPLYGWTGGQFAADQPGLGDLSVDLKGRVLDRDVSPVGVSLMGRVLFPTASVEVPLGSTGLGYEVTGIVDRDWDDFTFAANLGTRAQPRTEYDGLVWNDAVFARLGVGYAPWRSAGVSGELSMQTNWASGRNPAGTPVELMGGGWGRVREDLVARGAVSMGLSRSPGAPITRLVVGMGYEPDMYPDTDLDGIVNRDDWCPTEPEDRDGFEDTDGCLDRSVTVQLVPRAPDGSDVDAAITLDGPEHLLVQPGDAFVTLHPGTYTASLVAPGYLASVTELDIPLEPGAVLPLPMVALVGTVRLLVVDGNGNPVDADLQISGGDRRPADGAPMALGVGEHAIVVSAEGFEAQAVSVHVADGEAREIPVVLKRSGPASSTLPGPADDRVGAR